MIECVCVCVCVCVRANKQLVKTQVTVYTPYTNVCLKIAQELSMPHSYLTYPIPEIEDSSINKLLSEQEEGIIKKEDTFH